MWPYTFLNRNPFLNIMARSSTPRPQTMVFETSLFSPIVGSPLPTTPHHSPPKNISFNDDSMPGLANLSLSDSIISQKYHFQNERELYLDNLMADLTTAKRTYDYLSSKPELYGRMQEYDNALLRRNLGLTQQTLPFELIMKEREQEKQFCEHYKKQVELQNQDMVQLGEEACSKNNLDENVKNFSGLSQKSLGSPKFEDSLTKREKKLLRKKQKKRRRDKSTVAKNQANQSLTTCNCSCHVNISEAVMKLHDVLRCFNSS